MTSFILCLLLLCTFHGAWGLRRPPSGFSSWRDGFRTRSKIFAEVSWHPCWTVGIYESPDTYTSANEASSANSKPRERGTAGKFSKYAPHPDKAESMTSVEFRGNVYSAMKKAEKERKESQGGNLGAMVSDNYLDGLSSGRSSVPPRKYGISNSWLPEESSSQVGKKSYALGANKKKWRR